jgi:hypothetical protein
MPNPHKGEVELKAGDVSYVLCFSIDAICSLEDDLDKGFPAIAADMADAAKMRVSTVRTILRAGLREHHPELTLKQAGELIVTAGGAITVLGKIAEAFTAAFPSQEASGTKSPRQRANGRHPTGSPS